MVSQHDALPAILKILGTLTRNICGGVSFQYSYVIGDRLDSSNCLKEPYQRCFSGNLLKLSKQEFFQMSPEKCMKWFFISIKILSSNLVTLIKWAHYRFFLKVFPAISEHWQGPFFSKSVFFEAGNSRLLARSVREEDFREKVFWSFWNFRTSFPC